MTKDVGIVYHPDYLKHKTQPGHPERSERLQAIVDTLKRKGLLLHLKELCPKPAELQWVTSIHDSHYVERVREMCHRGYLQIDGSDTHICEDSYQIALLAVGGGVIAADAVCENAICRAFCCVRPPGHHAERSYASGFCLFNNIAILARYLQQKHGIKRVLIVDWDVHHGNGTQNAFYEDPTVFYFSTHQYPLFPGTGLSDEIGKGKGEGFTRNVPLSPGAGDEDFIQVYEEELIPIAERFAPEFVLISAGFDAHHDDPLAQMKMTEEGYERLTEIVCQIADTYCKGRVISLLEGGYNLTALGNSVAAHIEVLLKEKSSGNQNLRA